MYQAFNDNVIAKLSTTESASPLGIITLADKVPKYEVVAVTDTTKELLGKVVLTERSIALDTTHFSISYKDIVAVAE